MSKMMIMATIGILVMINVSAAFATEEVSILGANQADKDVLERWEILFDQVMPMMGDQTQLEWKVVKTMNDDQKMVVFNLVYQTMNEAQKIFVMKGIRVTGQEPLLPARLSPIGIEPEVDETSVTDILGNNAG